MTEPKIEESRVSVEENGPYVVTGDIPLAKQTIATNARAILKSGRRATATRRGRNMRCAAAVSRTPSRFVTAHMSKWASTAPRPQAESPI